MRSNVWRTVTVVTICALLTVMASQAEAKPTWGGVCTSCHDRARSAFTIVDSDGTDGGLNYYEVVAGESVDLSARVTDGHDDYAVSLLPDADLPLLQGPGSSWSDRSSFFVSSTGGHNWGGAATTRSFDLLVGAGQAPGDYELQFIVAGKNGGEWGESESFLVRVVPEPMIMSLLLAGGVVLIRRRRRQKTC